MPAPGAEAAGNRAIGTAAGQSGTQLVPAVPTLARWANLAEQLSLRHTSDGHRGRQERVASNLSEGPDSAIYVVARGRATASENIYRWTVSGTLEAHHSFAAALGISGDLAIEVGRRGEIYLMSAVLYWPLPELRAVTVLLPNGTLQTLPQQKSVERESRRTSLTRWLWRFRDRAARAAVSFSDSVRASAFNAAAAGCIPPKHGLSAVTRAAVVSTDP